MSKKLSFITIIAILIATTSAISKQSTCQQLSLDNKDVLFCLYHSTKATIITNLILLVFAVLISFALLIHFYLTKELHQKPGDIILMLCFSEFISAINQLLLSFLCTKSHASNSSWLRSISTHLAVILENIINFYHISFCLFHFMILKSALRGYKIPHFFFHLGPLMLALTIMSLYNMVQSLLVPAITFLPSLDIIGTVSKYVTLILLLSSFSNYIKRYLPQCEKVSQSEKLFLMNYEKYVTVLRFIFAIRCALEISTDYVFQQNFGQNKIRLFHLIMTFSHIITGIMPTYLLTPNNDFGMKKYWLKLTGKIQNSRWEKVNEFRKRKKKKYQAEVFQLQQIRKIQVLYSLLAGIHYFWNVRGSPNKLEKFSENKDIQELDNEGKNLRKEFKVKKVMEMTKKSLLREVPDIYKEMKDNGYDFAKGKLKIYMPQVFERIMKSDGVSERVTESLDLRDNLQEIASSGENKGGRSGEFFFFSKDNKLVMKTICWSELRMVLTVMPSYLEYISKNSGTLLTRIYGVFSFTFKYSGEKLHFILMDNINHCPEECIIRKYDIKGSTVGRRTIKEDEDVKLAEVTSDKTLKEMDLERFGEKLALGKDCKDKLLDVVKNDAQFLASMEILDYSLVIYIVDKEKCTHGESYLKDKNDEKKCFRCLMSVKEKVYYRVGIIDYLTKFGIWKKFEVFFKKLIALNPNHNISAQKPQFYAERFVNYVAKIID